MNELRCGNDNHLLAKYNGNTVQIRCRKCKKDHMLQIIDGQLQEVPENVEKTLFEKPSVNINGMIEIPIKLEEKRKALKYLMEHSGDIIY